MVKGSPLLIQVLKQVLQVGATCLRLFIKSLNYPFEASEASLAYTDGIVRHGKIFLEQVHIFVLHKFIKTILIILPELKNTVPYWMWVSYEKSTLL